MLFCCGCSFVLEIIHVSQFMSALGPFHVTLSSQTVDDKAMIQSHSPCLAWMFSEEYVGNEIIKLFSAHFYQYVQQNT